MKIILFFKKPIKLFLALVGLIALYFMNDASAQAAALSHGANFISQAKNPSVTSSVYTMNGLLVAAEQPLAPVDLTCIGSTSSTVTLSWQSSTYNVGIIEYEIYSDSQYLGVSTTNSYVVTGLEKYKSYTFSVKARDAAGNVSENSDPVTVFTSEEYHPPGPQTDQIG
ncbi:fibronectin type III domain-containing protein, partial [Paenibacillus lentus]|uniref:fibronectin type III domain-containing protein n=1 Tax=Paenibacillus lentus TaxID=1338368 RepID=UPI0036690475